MVEASGNMYQGEYKAGRYHGHGKLSYADGDAYEGQWREGEKHGHGKYSFATGDAYEGQWREGKKHGRGRFTFAKGIVEIGCYDTGAGAFVRDNCHMARDVHGIHMHGICIHARCSTVCIRHRRAVCMPHTHTLAAMSYDSAMMRVQTWGRASAGARTGRWRGGCRMASRGAAYRWRVRPRSRSGSGCLRPERAAAALITAPSRCDLCDRVRGARWTVVQAPIWLRGVVTSFDVTRCTLK